MTFKEYDDTLKDLLTGGRSFTKDGVRIPPEDMYKKPYCEKCLDSGTEYAVEGIAVAQTPLGACSCHAELLAMRERAVTIRRNRVEAGSLGEALLAQVIEILGEFKSKDYPKELLELVQTQPEDNACLICGKAYTMAENCPNDRNVCPNCVVFLVAKRKDSPEIKNHRKWLNREKKVWNGTDMLYSETFDLWFVDMNDVDNYLTESYSGDYEQLQLLIGEKVFASPLKPEDIYADDIAEELGLPPEVELAFQELNIKLKSCTTPLSWEVGRFRPTLESIKTGGMES